MRGLDMRARGGVGSGSPAQTLHAKHRTELPHAKACGVKPYTQSLIFFSLSELTVGDIPHGFVDKVLRIFYVI